MTKHENYIDEKYLTKLLQKNINEFVKIKSISEIVTAKQKPTTCDGDDNISNEQQQLVTMQPIVIATIKYEICDSTTTNCTLVFKSTLETKKMPAFIKILTRLSNEKNIYEFFISEFERIYKDMGMEKKFTPQYFENIDDANPNVIILKDPKDQNFIQINPVEGMNWKHAKATIKKLAEFHAISLVRRQRYGECSERDCVGLITPETREFFVQRYTTIIKAYVEAVPFNDRYAYGYSYLDTLPTAEQFGDEIMRLSEHDENGFNVLNHGSLCSKNIYFKYDEEKNDKIIETIFTNFEFCKYGSPAYDIYFLVNTSVNWEISDCLYNILKPYHGYLRRYLKLLKYKYEIPTLQQIDEMMKKQRFYAFFITIMYFPLVVMSSAGDEYNFDNMVTCDDETAEKLLQNVMTNKTYKRSLDQTMCHLYQTGAFDMQT